MNASRLWLLTAALAVGCATAPPPAVNVTPPPRRIEPAPRAEGVSVPWSRSFPLSWADFKGSAPADGVEGARTVYLLNYEWQCRGAAFQFVVTAEFLPGRSWVKPSVLLSSSESTRVLGHEQTHFNVTEVYARRIRRYLTGLYNPCAQNEDVLRSAIERYITDEAAMQKKYDDDTRFGLEAQRQRQWDRDILEVLVGLEKFSK